MCMLCIPKQMFVNDVGKGNVQLRFLYCGIEKHEAMRLAEEYCLWWVVVSGF